MSACAPPGRGSWPEKVARKGFAVNLDRDARGPYTPLVTENEVETPYNARLLDKRQITPLLAVFKVEPEVPAFPFVPGQYTVLGLLGGESRVHNAQPEATPPPPGKLLRRPYSIANGPREAGFFEFYVTLVVTGALAPRLFDRLPGDRLFLGRKALGTFTLETIPPDRPLLLVATGTGLAPLVSMIRHELGQGASRTLVLLEGVRYSWSLGYREELEEWARRCPSFRYVPSITRVELDPDWRGPTGRMDTLLADRIIERETGLRIDPREFDALLCGNPGMVDGVTTWLEGQGFRTGAPGEPGCIHTEKYWAS
jgi:ferredoxin--NADP+ reductase